MDGGVPQDASMRGGSDILVDFYSKPQLGGGFPVFQGSRRQIGGSFLSSLARFAIPVLKFLGKKVLGVAGNVASDVIDKKMSFRESVPKRAKEGMMETISDVRKQTGLGKRKQRGRKRPAVGKLTIPQHPSKRKRVAKMDINTPPLPPNTIFD